MVQWWSATKSVLLIGVVAAILGGCSSNSTSSSPQPPKITQFATTPADFNPSDTLTLSYTITGADSAILTPPGQKLSSTAAGDVKVVPRQAARYVLTAYNADGRDSSVVNIDINLSAPNGSYYKGALDSSRLSPALNFRITNSAGTPMTKPWLHVSLLGGDGQLSADSLLPNASGIVNPAYTFSDTVGQAIIRAVIPGFDTIDVNLRADALTPGPHGQGQYVSFDDQYGIVKALNGAPVSNDVDPNFWVTYANYETPLGVVVEIDDANQNNKADDSEAVLGVIVTTIYQGETKYGIRIGSPYSAVVAAYGQPDTIRYDPTAPPAYIIKYIYKGLVFVGVPADTSIEQIEVSKFVQAPVAMKTPTNRVPASLTGAFRAPRLR